MKIVIVGGGAGGFELAALYGFWRVSMLTLANLLTKRLKPRLKLH